MKKLSTLLIATGLVVLGGGCTPDPEKVCDKANELDEKADADKPKDEKADPKLDEIIKKAREEKKKECPKMMGALKEVDGDVYKCMAKCVMDATDRKVMKKCDDTCPGAKEAFKKTFEKLKGSK